MLVREGDTVEEGQELFIMEVMKMEVPYTAPIAGQMTGLHIREGDVVEEGLAAAEIELIVACRRLKNPAKSFRLAAMTKPVSDSSESARWGGLDRRDGDVQA